MPNFVHIATTQNWFKKTYPYANWKNKSQMHGLEWTWFLIMVFTFFVTFFLFFFFVLFAFIFEPFVLLPCPATSLCCLKASNCCLVALSCIVLPHHVASLHYFIASLPRCLLLLGCYHTSSTFWSPLICCFATLLSYSSLPHCLVALLLCVGWYFHSLL